MSDVKIELSKIDLGRVKREAKRTAKHSRLKYCAVLNDCARVYGFETFASLQSNVKAARHATSPAEPIEPELEALLTWFRSRFTRIEDVGKYVSPLIAKALRDHQRATGRPPFHMIDIGDEIDFGYNPKPFQTRRHPQALAAEMLLEAEGDWVSNTWLDSLKVRKGGLWGDGQDDVVGHRITLSIYDEA
ncbi:hypothetical protein [Stutzerimonas kunmingensis]|uniref:hypothetical protein n=1 Tax=Stutzerimonas kunmingensis TaxID=1211807 RepID=UPI0028ADE7DC|nr:hypothetical protein [Stutzerimonas kunmingensis]